MQIGEKIKNYRKTAGLTQEQVADYFGRFYSCGK